MKFSSILSTIICAFSEKARIHFGTKLEKTSMADFSLPSQRIHTYNCPLDIALLFEKKEDVVCFFMFLVDKLETLCDENMSDTYLPPAVQYKGAYTINIDYRFLIACISEWSGIEKIMHDFSLLIKEDLNGLFLVSVIFEKYYRLTFLNKLNAKSIKNGYHGKDKFFNILIMENGGNQKLYHAVPFSLTQLKKLLQEECYTTLQRLSSSPKFVQIAFGDKKVGELYNPPEAQVDPVF